MSDMTWPVATYLRGERYGLRAPVLGDAEDPGAWYEGAFPITPEAARTLLEEQETIPWGTNPTIRLIAIDLETGTIAGGALVERTDNRVSTLVITAGGPDQAGAAAQRFRADMLRLLLPWVMGELDLMTAVIDVPADETILIETARELGMVEAARLREHIRRPAGRVDLLMLERVNRQWGRRDA